MRQIRNLISLCIVFIFSKDLIYPDCEQYVFNEIFREEFEGSFATRSGETIDSQNNFVVVDEETGKLVAVSVMGMKKSISEGQNFGIKTSSVKNFLEANKVKVQSSWFGASDVAKLLEDSTLYTYCN